MNYSTLKEKYKKKLERLNDSIKSYKESSNAELQIAASTLEKEKEEVELLLAAICGKERKEKYKFEVGENVYANPWETLKDVSDAVVVARTTKYLFGFIPKAYYVVKWSNTLSLLKESKLLKTK